MKSMKIDLSVSVYKFDEVAPYQPKIVVSEMQLLSGPTEYQGYLRLYSDGTQEYFLTQVNRIIRTGPIDIYGALIDRIEDVIRDGG